jgi:protein arginine N-methyltransferase 1
VYEIHDYDAMFADPVRTTAYLDAIARGVRPGHVVVEIGTGVGFFAVAACRAGARRVHAIEVNPAVDVGAQIAADNGCADRITFYREDSRRVALPDRGDVLLSDLRGVLPLYGDHIATLVDARARLLRPGAILIPRRDHLCAAPCSAPPDWRRDHVLPGDAPHGIDRRAVEARVRNNWYRCRLERDSLLADGVQWAVLDYAAVESPDVAGPAEWTITADGIAEGVAVWFDADLGFGATLTNAPGAPRAVYGQAFYPFRRALAMHAGDHLAVEFRAHLAGDEYVWGWNTRFTPRASDARASAPVLFTQTDLAARIVSLDALRALAAERAQEAGS